jgi:hypothetical protein
VINMSLVSDMVYPGECDAQDGFTRSFARVIGMLRDGGTLTFAASGNGGETSAISAPACVHAAVGVGAVTKRDRVASFSNSSTAIDLLAPGAGILSDGPGGSTAILSGTSMAAPHATGTAALLLAINPALAADAVESMLESSGVYLTDTRNGLTRPRVNALSSMNAAWNQAAPVLGGGSKRTDCLVTWMLTPADIATSLPVAGAVCHDNDPHCDGDQTPGQCTFQLSMCFNVPDRRVPYCDTGLPIVGTTLAWPRTTRGSSIDVGNAEAIGSALPALPIEETNRCTGPIPFVVPTAPGGGKQWIHFAARGASNDGNRDRIDSDRLRLTCLPAATGPTS